MVKVLVLGSTGMLGNAVGNWFLNHPEQYETHLTYRNEDMSYGENKVFYDCLSGSLEELPRTDYVINCVGTIKPFMAKNPTTAIEINSIFPWRLAEHCETSGAKMIHITTDCVYSGAKGSYSEEDLHDALDNYGKSKSLGEPTNCMVLRTSIIGEEIHKNVSLVEWIKSQRNKTVNGYTNHLWNGITTRQYAKICDQIISNSLYEIGKFHINSPAAVTKDKLLYLLGEKFDLGLTINKFKAPTEIDRTLASTHNLCSQLNIPTIEHQIIEI